MASVKVSEEVSATAESVWDLLRDFGGVTRYSAGIESCEVDGEGVGAVRTLGLPGGISLQERLEAFDDAGRRLQYSIIAGPLPFENYLATIEVSESGDTCRIDWGSTFDPKGVSDDQAIGMVEGIYKGGIAGIKKTLSA
jgi:carbon monoxide dehydrogenase subunit G